MVTGSEPESGTRWTWVSALSVWKPLSWWLCMYAPSTYILSTTLLPFIWYNAPPSCRSPARDCCILLQLDHWISETRWPWCYGDLERLPSQLELVELSCFHHNLAMKELSRAFSESTTVALIHWDNRGRDLSLYREYVHRIRNYPAQDRV